MLNLTLGIKPRQKGIAVMRLRNKRVSVAKDSKGATDMPVYVFKCKKEDCGETHTKLQKFDDPPPPCPQCKGETERVLGQSSFILKGSGWFKTGGY
jgi:putative FmdB family regulatory protein